jgi:mono/diheme cytochrome c family protein
MNVNFKKNFQLLALALIGIIIYFGIGLVTGESTVYAYPEYATRTNESCSTCHVNPGGGGPRTLRGLLWSAQGRQDLLPILGDILIAPGVTDGVELYDVACASCHGSSAEGLFGVALVSSGITNNKIRVAIERGRERSGMPSFEGKFTEEQLTTLIEYVTGIASGKIDPAPISYPLPLGKLECTNTLTGDSCGGN